MGRILAIDFGLRRVGAAISDPGWKYASPLEVYERRTEALDQRHYRELVAENEVERIVVGLPVHTTGREGQLATLARQWGAWLAAVTTLPVTFSDERYTSVEADDLMIGAGLKRKKRKGMRDKIAAQILLQAYLDAGCPEEAKRLEPLADEEPRNQSEAAGSM